MNLREFLSISTPAIVSFVLGVSPALFPKLLDRKYARILLQVFEAIDPILAGDTKEYGGFGVSKIVSETIATIDKNLTHPEIGEATALALKRFDPAIAASKLENSTSLAIAQEIAKTEGDISKLDLSRIRWNFSIGNN